MEIEKWTEKIPRLFKKYRYPIVVVLIGLVILTIPRKRDVEPDQVTPTNEIQQNDITQQLTAILSKIDGVGKVEVMLTIQTGETTYYQRDEDINGGNETSSVRQETVILTDSQRNQYPLVTQVLPPKYQGAIIVCQGADQPTVKWAIVEAVSKATGLGADQISILKMK